MNSSLIGKIEKARRYAEERQRIQFSEFTASVAGDNDTYLVQYRDGGWHCSCEHFAKNGSSSHTMALERIMSGMVSTSSNPAAGGGSSQIGRLEKAKRYADEPGRIRFLEFEVDFRGDNDNYRVGHSHGDWRCTCNYFVSRGLCCHTMALEKILDGMMPAGSRSHETVPAAIAI